MQNMYVGDIGDYGKYGLLRALFPTQGDYILGIVWYLVPDEIHKTDGRHIAYLTKPSYRQHDAELFDILKGVVDSGRRHIDEIQKANIFSPDAIYLDKTLSFYGISAYSSVGRNRRLAIRKNWLEEALRVTEKCDAVFLDPDNGIETPSVLKHTKAGPKYVYLDEIEKFASRGQTVVVYHHFGHHGTHEHQIRQRKKQLREKLGNHKHIISLRFKRYSPRAYFVITESTRIVDGVKHFVNSSWKQCFELVG